MLFSPVEIQSAACSPAERREALRLADSLAEMAETASKEGLFALSRYEKDQPAFLAEGITVLMDAPEESRDARLRESALAGGRRGRELLERLMIAQGLAGIAAGADAALVRLKLKVYAGQEIFFGERREEAIQQFMSLGFDRGTAEQLAATG